MIPSNGLSIVGHLIDAGRPIVSSDDVNYCKLDWQQYTRKSFCWITFSTILPSRDETRNMFPKALQFPSTTQTRSLRTWEAQVCELLTGSDIVTVVGPTNGLQSTDGRAGRRDFWVTLTSYVYIDLFIGPGSDHCLALSLTLWLTVTLLLRRLEQGGSSSLFSVLKRKTEGTDKKLYLEIVFIEHQPCGKLHTSGSTSGRNMEWDFWNFSRWIFF